MNKGNFKMRCVNTGGDTGLTLDKIYEVKNGYSKWNDGMKMPQFKSRGVDRFDSIEDVNTWMGYVRFELVEEASYEIHIANKSTTTYGVMKKGNKVVKRAEAKLNPIDTFDFEYGAELVMKRLLNFVPHLQYEDCDYGTIGTPSNITALFGEKLFVGDMVECYDTDEGIKTKAFVIDSDGIGIMGIHFLSLNMKNGISEYFQVRKIKSYKDLAHGEKDSHGIKAILKED